MAFAFGGPLHACCGSIGFSCHVSCASALLRDSMRRLGSCGASICYQTLCRPSHPSTTVLVVRSKMRVVLRGNRTCRGRLRWKQIPSRARPTLALAARFTPFIPQKARMHACTGIFVFSPLSYRSSLGLFNWHYDRAAGVE